MLILAETDISVSRVGKGQFIRWYLNGWHYLFLEQGSESQVVEGTEALPSSYSRLALQAYGLKEGDLRAAKTVAFAPSLDLLTVDGWRNAILESGSVETKRTGASLYPISLTVNVFGKVADYSPVAEVVPPLTDLDILRQIRAANPTSQLPALWLDSEDPYTQWEGVGWTADKTEVFTLDIGSRAITVLPNINKLKSLTRIQCPVNNIATLDLSNMPALGYVNAGVNNLSFVNLDGTPEIYQLQLWSNRLTDVNLTLIQDKLRVLELDLNLLSWVPSLTFKNTWYTYYDFRYNNFPTAELDRFRAMGFTNESRLLPQNP